MHINSNSRVLEMGGIRYFAVIIIGVLGFFGSTQAQLQLDFYSKSCPRAEKIIQDFVNKHIHNAPSLAAALLRMHFHDCFVRGCDGSVLLNSTSSNQAEKDGGPNLTIRGFDFIDRVKSLLEAECPGIVSCADTIALVARDSVVATVLTPLASLIVHPSLPDCIISLGWAIRTLLWTVNMLQISRQGSAQILMIIPQLLRWTPEAARLSTLATTLSC
ncbi:hypothetical protein I3760_03G156000 [Carya illinoinensis]|nr:hypothetical protein I3760_03G156000 [Carya illinoinensis]